MPYLQHFFRFGSAGVVNGRTGSNDLRQFYSGTVFPYLCLYVTVLLQKSKCFLHFVNFRLPPLLAAQCFLKYNTATPAISVPRGSAGSPSTSPIEKFGPDFESSRLLLYVWMK